MNHAGYRGAQSPRERAAAGVLSAAILLLFGMVLWRMGMMEHVPKFIGDNLVAVNIGAPKSAASKASPAKHQPVPQPRTPDQPVPLPVPPPKLVIPNEKAPPAFIPMSSDDMASADISKMRGPAGAGSKGDSKTAYGPGEGPQGQVLYKAEWYREPTRAEIAGYLTERSAGAEWAVIACKTIDDYHVENCQELGESPRGSGLARSLRQAAWQFRVIPPRVNGKPMIGAWVRIRFDFLRGRAN